MESPDLGTVQEALALVEEALNGRSHATAAVPYFAPTDIGGLPPAMQEAELRNEEEIAYGNRVRAGVHMSLAAAAASLRVCETLMKDSSQVAYSDRQQQLQRCAEDAQASKDLADHAVEVLAGRAPPKSDAMTEIRKIKAAVYQRFGQLSGGKP